MMESKIPLYAFAKFILVIHLIALLWLSSLYSDAQSMQKLLTHDGFSLQSQMMRFFLQAQNMALLFQAEPVAPADDEHPVHGADYVYNHRKWGGECPVIPFRVNINTEQAGVGNGSEKDFRKAIISAATTWSSVPGADYTLVYDGPTDATEIGFNGVNEIVFMNQGLDQPSGLARFWFTGDDTIVEADIWINNDYQWDATGEPSLSEVDLESVALHEFGHWLSLGHDDDDFAVMAPTIQMGTLKRELSENEIEAIEFIYPREADSNCASGPPSSPTPEPAATLTPTPVSTPLPTPTLVLTAPPTVTPVSLPTPRINSGYPVFLPLIAND